MKRSELKVGDHVAYNSSTSRSYRGFDTEVIVVDIGVWRTRSYRRGEDISQPLEVTFDGEARTFDISAYRRDNYSDKRTVLVAYAHPKTNRVFLAQLGHLRGPWVEVQAQQQQEQEVRAKAQQEHQAEMEQQEHAAEALSQRLGVKFREGTYGGYRTVNVDVAELTAAIDRLISKVQ